MKKGKREGEKKKREREKKKRRRRRRRLGFEAIKVLAIDRDIRYTYDNDDDVDDVSLFSICAQCRH